MRVITFVWPILTSLFIPSLLYPFPVSLKAHLGNLEAMRKLVIDLAGFHQQFDHHEHREVYW